MSCENKLWRITMDTNPEDCNYHCIMCEEHSKYSHFKQNLKSHCGITRREMPTEWLEPIFRQAAELGVKEIIPSTMGEPLLYKGIDDFFLLAEKYALKINLTTNGSFPRKSMEEWAKLIIPHTTDIKISINGATKITSESIMQGSNFDTQIENIKHLITYRNQYFAKTGYYCRVTLQLTFMQNNMQELADIVKMAAELDVDRIKGHHLWTHFKELNQLSMKESVQSIHLWNQYVSNAIEAQEKHRKPNGEKVLLENIVPIDEENNQEVPNYYDCPFLGKELWISATGTISPCCAPDELRKSLGDFGNIENTTIQKVMESSIYKRIVDNYKNIELCKTCNMRKSK